MNWEESTLKSRSIEIGGMLKACLLLGLCSSVAGAGVSKIADMAAAPVPVVPNEERARSGGVHELPTSLERSERNRSESIMQCWQYGRLIIDERDWEARNLDSSGPLLYSSDGRHARMRLMQFGDTFCALRYGAQER
jgi:hypothetical protein